MVFVINFVHLRAQSSVPIFTWERDYWLHCSLTLWTLLYSSRSPLSPPSPFSSLPNSVNLFVHSMLWRTLRELITGWICLSPFDSPFYPPGHLCLLPPSFLLCITPWTSLSSSAVECTQGSDYWLACSLFFWFHLISFGSPLTSSSLFSSSCNSVNLSGCPSLWRNFSSLT